MNLQELRIRIITAVGPSLRPLLLRFYDRAPLKLTFPLLDYSLEALLYNLATTSAQCFILWAT